MLPAVQGQTREVTELFDAALVAAAGLGHAALAQNLLRTMLASIQHVGYVAYGCVVRALCHEQGPEVGLPRLLQTLEHVLHMRVVCFVARTACSVGSILPAMVTTVAAITCWLTLSGLLVRQPSTLWRRTCPRPRRLR